MAANNDIEQDKPQHTTTSRGALALGFAYIGAKIGTLGTIVDVDKVPGTEKLTFGQKVWQTLNFKIPKQLWREMMEKPGFVEKIKFASERSKFTLITTGVGMAAGAALGWARGNRIEKPSDLLFHPIRSLKAALGPKPEPAVSDALMLAKKEIPQDLPATVSGMDKVWTQAVTKPQPMQAAEAAPGR